MTTTQSGIMDRLREETADAHRRAESNPLEQALFRGAIPRAAFVKYLEQRICIHRELDTLVRELTVQDSRLRALVPDDHYQTPNLEADLRFFGANPANVAAFKSTANFCRQLDAWSSGVRCALLGAYYVFEGSKNGARMLARGLAAAYNLKNGEGLRYMDPHGAEQRPLWQAFRERMNAIDFSNVERDEMVRAATTTFNAVFEVDNEIWSRVESVP